MGEKYCITVRWRTRVYHQRTREIGIRKVLRASVVHIAMLISLESVKLVLAANVVVWPVAYFAMQDWLQAFAYHIDLGVGIFALSGVLALAIILLTVSSLAVRAALINPVDALRCE